MKQALRSRRNEEGQVLIYVTLALVLAMLIIPPLLGFVFTAGRSAQIREDRMLEVHAADTGIEDGYYYVVANETDLPLELPTREVNGHEVDVEILETGDAGVYRVISTATDDTGAAVTIEAYTSRWDYLGLMDNALSSYGDITLSPNTVVVGNYTYNGELDNKGDIEGTYDPGGVPGWPPADELAEFYLTDEVLANPLYDSVINLTTDETRGPLYRNGNLDLISGNDSAALTLEGTIYVTGELTTSNAKNFTLYLNNQTIFCEQNITLGGKCTLVGPGCIIAIGDVYFSPKMQGTDFIFVMSVEGTLTAQPQGYFFGSMAGNIEIQYQPGTEIWWVDYDVETLNFPPGSTLPRVISYTILD